MKAILMLEDGTVFEGRSFGAEGEKAGTVIFNTQIIGYQEILTDPAYAGQIVAMGYPHIGNYGINDRLFESDTAHALALVVKEYSKIYSNWQATGSLGDYMKKSGVIGIEGIDTRSLTIHIREHGEMKGIISTKDFNVEELMAKAKNFKHPTSNLKTNGNKPIINDKEPRRPPASQCEALRAGSAVPAGRQVAGSGVMINIGVSKSVLASFPGARVVSAETTAEKILALEPEEVIISSGPGDPREMTALVAEVKKLVGKVKLTGIQNGACVLALALGAAVERMKVGHHGMNIPVVEPKTGKGEITMQNHSYGVQGPGSSRACRQAGVKGEGIEIVHKNLNDGSIEAFKTKKGDCVGLLYYPIDQRGKLPKGYKEV